MQEPQEVPKAESVYKIIQGAFERKTEVIGAVGMAKKKGFPARLIIEKGKYGLLFTETISKTEAAAVIDAMKQKGIKADIYNIEETGENHKKVE
ncbi:hypothetical protein SAMN05443270_4576 [Lacrimispora sphenoides]|nr:hypothetical protein SAMN05443270_4576 [Lacrimispora sphenoides]